MKVTSEHSITDANEQVVLKVNKLVKPGILLTLGCIITTTQKILAFTTNRLGPKVRQEDILISSRPNFAAPTNLAGRRNFPHRTTATVLIRIRRRLVAQKLHRQNHTNQVPDLLCDPEGSPENFIKSAPHLVETEMGSHHVWLTGLAQFPSP
jgi:hypothetical protein